MSVAYAETPQGARVSFDDLDLLGARVQAEADFFWFCTEIMGYPDLYPPLHEDQVCLFLQDFGQCEQQVGNLELARGHFKTTLASICYPLWLLLREPNLRILLTHGKRDTAVKILREIKFHLIHTERLRAIAPDIFWHTPHKDADVWLADQITVKRTLHDKVPSIMATGVDASVVGLHFHLIIHDDLVFKEVVNTPEMREKTKEYRREAFALLNRPPMLAWSEVNKILNIGTRWHFDDAHQELEDGAAGEGPYAGMVHQLKLGCRDDDGMPLMPTRWTNEKLEQTRQMMGSFVFSAQFENNPIPQGEEFFRRSDIRWFEDLPGHSNAPNAAPNTQRPYLFFTAVDPNRTEKEMADPCVVMTAARDEDGHVWVVDISRGHPTGTELVKIIRSHLERWDPQKVILEANNFQYQLQTWLKEDQLRRGRCWPIEPVTRYGRTRKVERIGALQPLVERGALHLKHGMEVVAQELEHWPSWKHDDCLDCLADIYTYGSNPEPRGGRQEMPTNYMTMESILSDMRGRREGPRARFGARAQSQSGWIFR